MTIMPIVPQDPLEKAYAEFLTALQKAGFEGDISHSHADRTVLATDNSIYQLMPQAAVYPRGVGDVQQIARLLAQPSFRKIVVAPRGGGTGTNGQSLTDGLVVDLSRHMNCILDIDVPARRVRVQAGVVKDQLNKALKPHGLFFAPELSTSNRATIGGMVSTDASGQGSCTYGKTRNHVLTLSSVLLGGAHHESHPITDEELERLCAEPGTVGKAYAAAARIEREQADLIAEKFPKLNRCLTGYDLAHLRETDGRFNLNSILCGAEGSLGFLVEATLAVMPIPKHTTLVNIRYATFMDALHDARALMEHHPLSIETVDSKVLLLAMNDMVWQNVEPYFPPDAQHPTLGINLVEFSGEDPLELADRVAAFRRHLGVDTSVIRLGHTLAMGAEAVDAVYAMRKRAVGLLGAVDGEARPQPFVEDTAVPPQHLAAYIEEFRALLDGYGLQYGMFGHVDAGVLHVRPALDMKNPADVALVRPISEGVVRLTQKYGGLLWGEHGKGFRSEFSPNFFGSLYPALQAIKSAFDPHNQFNPGKIATPLASSAVLRKVDGVPLRGDLDRQIDERVWQSYGTAMKCNGNGACYNFDPDDAMCPSWKATRNRIHSPKGRASLLREWLRLQQAAGVDVLQAEDGGQPFFKGLLSRWKNARTEQKNASPDFSHEVYDAMAGCLACKSCAAQCPVKVSVPEFRSRFLALYHARYQRPIRDYLIGSLEHTVPYFARVPRLYNALMASPPVARLLEKQVGMVDSPLLSRFAWNEAARRWGAREATPQALDALTAKERLKSVVFVQDAFTRFFESPLSASYIELAARLGYTVYMAPFLPNGKPLQVQGFLPAFNAAATRNAAKLKALASSGVALVGLDPAMTLVYRQEYRKVPGLHNLPEVLLPQEWLLKALPAEQALGTGTYRLLPHCTERTNVASSSSDWVQVFSRLGLTLQVQRAGCCGMSGTYGHEARNVATSRIIFEQSWAAVTDKHDEAELLATGYSCRSQVKRMRQTSLRHPLEVILDITRLRSSPSMPVTAPSPETLAFVE
jgi:FAD/FMN-containing dehydrogenase/Fe-S oxidoreductase